jgi:maltooligosyltrehalose synthase
MASWFYQSTILYQHLLWGSDNQQRVDFDNRRMCLQVLNEHPTSDKTLTCLCVPDPATTVYYYTVVLVSKI